MVDVAHHTVASVHYCAVVNKVRIVRNPPKVGSPGADLCTSPPTVDLSGTSDTARCDARELVPETIHSLASDTPRARPEIVPVRWSFHACRPSPPFLVPKRSA